MTCSQCTQQKLTPTSFHIEYVSQIVVIKMDYDPSDKKSPNQSNVHADHVPVTDSVGHVRCSNGHTFKILHSEIPEMVS